MFEERIIKISEEINEELINIRRDIHAHPEIGFHEERTSGIIAEELKKLGIEVKTNIAGTGVAGILKGSKPGKTIMLRADMDCLRIDEKNQVEYKSLNEGFMHACGHDAHTAWLLGAAKILSRMREDIKGNVKFFFQPAEEYGAGAIKAISEGVLEAPHVDAILGAHVWPTIESGKIGIKKGALMAATDFFQITITGKGGHGAQPENCIDPISISCQIYNSFQNIVSRRVSPFDSVVITVGKFVGGTAKNIIPDKVEMEGTVRTLNENIRKSIPEMMESIIKGITSANKAGYEFRYEMYHPAVINDSSMTELAENAASRILGKSSIERLDMGTMVGEDFSNYQKKVPGAFIWIGTLNNEKGIGKPLHTPDFNIDEEIIHKASAVMSECALDFLNGD